MTPNDLKVRCPATVIVSGPTGSGKSSVVKEIIHRLPEVFDRPPTQVTYCYSIYQPLFEELRQQAPLPLEFVHELSDNLKLQPRTLLILDDLQHSSKLIADYFTKHSHHLDVDVIYITQNIFLQNDAHRTCNLNTHILSLFKNPRNSQQITFLARQISPGNHKFILDAYRQATKRPHGYLFLNLQQSTPEHLRIRDSFFYTEANIFVDKKEFRQIDLSQPDLLDKLRLGSGD